MNPLDIQVTYDFICPWCWIGHAHLKAALREANLAVAPAIKYLPYELNPTMPKDGIDRKAYRSAKFGSWARSLAMDADVTLAGKRAGVEFNYDRVAVTPNTRLAHRLMFLAQSKGDAARTEALFEAVFSAYFSDGQDIGMAEVLVSLAERTDFDADEVRSFLATNDGEREVVADELRAGAAGIRSVPAIRVGGVPVSGAQPVSVLAEVLRHAIGDKTANAAV
ncbi:MULTISPECIES: DsbA family oxidoreductase [Burkholderia]|uniref:DsbA family oxidoreductase n=1 Tax=Burkholderia contaminans TaxID=488447 RepID=A0A2S5E6E0_9BURK|nr:MULTISPECIES: DsbA family oxidoreductase [Burkholderia]EKS9796672.1 DsbA family oxidoreductase [Burkholderia cepacia]EKS9802463.1 DsbA family oxidoreductase [Burkholderia cepacia]EKS9809777.1 DsbA family oxidoreductase [Burkholderia cepacia]EKS9818466.1 DsbA family oxidoreductase [Burkholderia cepacia]EKS9824347.1 DsbA family oxidoreductase [Burkholderia cepacia]